MEWKKYDELYEVSDSGNMKNIKSGRILAIRTTPEGYVHYCLHGKNVKVHKLVAQLFIQNHNPNQLKCVNHKDGNKLNNHHSNLEWCTQGHNLKHAWDVGLNKGASKKVRAYKDGQLVGEYKSQYDCARQLGLGLSSVNVSIHFGYSMYGYTFEKI